MDILRRGGTAMTITDIRVKPMRNGNKMKAVVSITIDGCFVIHDIRVIDGNKGLFVAMPSKREEDGTHRDICHPTNQETRNMIKTMVLEKYDEVIATDYAADSEDDSE